MDIQESIVKILNPSICDSEETYTALKNRSEEGNLTRDENPQTHFVVYFLCRDPENGKVFIVHHKKSGLWLCPGGHVDKGETLMQTLNREIEEELGVRGFFNTEQKPFLLTITLINNQVQPCKRHYDVWYLVPTDGKDFQIDPREFHDTEWMTIAEARKIVTDPGNLKALAIINRLR